MTNAPNIDGGGAGGGNSNAGGAGLGQVIGFVTEFNQNVQIFGQLIDALTALVLMTSSNTTVDPDAFGDWYADESTYGDGAQGADQRLYYENREKARQAAKEADPLYQIQQQIDTLKPDLEALKAEMLVATINITGAKTTADSAKTAAGMALARANEALEKANALPQSDATDWRAHHNKPD